MGKTAEQWFQDLEGEIKEILLDKIKPEFKDVEYTYLHEALSMSLDWTECPVFMDMLRLYDKEFSKSGIILTTQSRQFPSPEPHYYSENKDSEVLFDLIGRLSVIVTTRNVSIQAIKNAVNASFDRYGRDKPQSVLNDF